MTSLAFAAVATALQRFSAFLVTNHTAHSQTYDCKQHRQSNRCSHKYPPFRKKSYLASIFPPPLNFSVVLSLYGLTSR